MLSLPWLFTVGINQPKHAHEEALEYFFLTRDESLIKLPVANLEYSTLTLNVKSSWVLKIDNMRYELPIWTYYSTALFLHSTFITLNTLSSICNASLSFYVNALFLLCWSIYERTLQSSNKLNLSRLNGLILSM